MITYKVPTKFIFEGGFFVEANSEEEAERLVKEQCDMVMSHGIRTRTCSRRVTWDFETDPEKIVGEVIPISSNNSAFDD